MKFFDANGRLAGGHAVTARLTPRQQLDLIERLAPLLVAEPPGPASAWSLERLQRLLDAAAPIDAAVIEEIGRLYHRAPAEAEQPARFAEDVALGFTALLEQADGR